MGDRGQRLSGGRPGAAGGSVTEKTFRVPYEEPLEVKSVGCRPGGLFRGVLETDVPRICIERKRHISPRGPWGSAFVFCRDGYASELGVTYGGMTM